MKLIKIYDNVFIKLEKAKTSKEKKIERVIQEFAAGKLKSSDGKIVTDREQALAIAYSESENMAKAKYIRKMPNGKGGFKYIYREKKQREKEPKKDKDMSDIACYAGACDRLRKKEGGEEFWQKMMDTKKEIKELDFLKNVNIKDALDEDETWSEYKSMAKKEGDPVKLYESENAFFFQTAGFEFIWKKKNENMAKAKPTKYIKKIPRPSGKGYYYFYNQKQIKDYKEKDIFPDQKDKEEKKSIFSGIMSFFGFKDQKQAKEKIKETYSNNKEQLKGIDVETFGNYMNEYLSNKEKWDKKLSKKEIITKDKKTDKIKRKKATDKKTVISDKSDKKWNISLMKKIAGIVGEDKIISNKHNLLKENVLKDLKSGSRIRNSDILDIEQLESMNENYNGKFLSETDLKTLEAAKKRLKTKEEKPEKELPKWTKSTIETGDIKIITDHADRQKKVNSLREGEMILKSGKTAIGRKMSKEELDSVKRSVDKARKQLGLSLTEKVPSDINDPELLKKIKIDMDNNEIVKQLDKKDYPEKFSIIVKNKDFTRAEGGDNRKNIEKIIDKKEMKGGFEIFGEKFVITKTNYGNWMSLEPKSGRSAGSGKTIKEAVGNSIKAIQQAGEDKLKELIKQPKEKLVTEVIKDIKKPKQIEKPKREKEIPKTEKEIPKTDQAKYDNAKKTIAVFEEENERSEHDEKEWEDALDEIEEDARSYLKENKEDKDTEDKNYRKYYKDSEKDLEEVLSYKKALKDVPELKEKLLGPKLFKAKKLKKSYIKVHDNIYIDLEKAKAMPIGTVSKGQKKVAEGKWVPVDSKEKNGKEKKPEKKTDKKDDKKEEISKEASSKRETIKNALKKIANILADALSGKDVVTPTGQAVEETGKVLEQKKKDKKKKEVKKPKEESKNK